MFTYGGSSPLTRGKPSTPRPRVSRSRLIPAHAGKTPRGRRATARKPAHPRSRGENADRQRETAAAWGSSPLTRGKPRGQPQPRHGDRLIPAHAGKTAGASRAIDPTTAHPRSRGENSHPHAPSRVRIGSSPLTRGKLIALNLSKSVSRLIPAHAGKTARLRALSLRSAAHPRSRGENTI